MVSHQLKAGSYARLRGISILFVHLRCFALYNCQPSHEAPAPRLALR